VCDDVQVLAVFESRVGTPSRDIYNKVLEKFVQLYDSKKPTDFKSGPEFVASMKQALGALWTDKLREPILELYTAIQAQAQSNFENVRRSAAQLNARQNQAQVAAASAVQHRYASLYAGLSSALASAQASASALSHWSLRRVYQSGSDLVTAALDRTVQKSLTASAYTLGMSLLLFPFHPASSALAWLSVDAVTDFTCFVFVCCVFSDLLLPRGEGEEAASAPVATTAPAPEPTPAPSADAKSAPTGSAAGPIRRLTLRALRDRASARVTARLNRAFTATRELVTRSEKAASASAHKLQAAVGVDVLTPSQQLWTSLETQTCQASERVTAAKRAALDRVRASLQRLNAECSAHAQNVTALLAGWEQKCGVSGVRQSAVSAVQVRLSAALLRLQSLAAKAKDVSNEVLDREVSFASFHPFFLFAASFCLDVELTRLMCLSCDHALCVLQISVLPQDLLRLVRLVPTLLPAPVQSASATASTKLHSLFSSVSEVVRSIAAYAHLSRRASAPAAATPSASTTASSSASTTAAATTTTTAAAAPAASASASTPATAASTTSSSSSSSTPVASPKPAVKSIAAQYEAAARTPSKTKKQLIAEETVKSADDE
jgi:hypothetical protein